MSSKATILLTHDGEHFYHDCDDNTINLEFDKRNAEISSNENYDYIRVELKPNGTQLYKLFELIQHNDIIRAEIEKHIPNIL